MANAKSGQKLQNQASLLNVLLKNGMFESDV
jgi:hypothetical protein